MKKQIAHEKAAPPCGNTGGGGGKKVKKAMAESIDPVELTELSILNYQGLSTLRLDDKYIHIRDYRIINTGRAGTLLEVTIDLDDLTMTEFSLLTKKTTPPKKSL